MTDRGCGEEKGRACLAGLPPLREVIAAHDLAARKGLGQHFLLDLNLTQKIVRAAGDLAGVSLVEIGPGPGGLTRPMVESAASQVVAIEKDRRCIGALADLVAASCGRLRVLEADALTVDVVSLVPAPRAIIANLPYNVGTPLLIQWLRQLDQFQSLTLMFQAEVVDRLVAPPDTDSYGRLSVITQFMGVARRVLSIPARAFTPPPKIDSAVVHITPRQDRPADVSFATIEKITAAAFGQRRKMLRSSLKALGGETLLEAAGIPATCRAEELPVSAYENLARIYEKK